MRVANQLKFSKAVIEDEQHTRNHEDHFRNVQIVARMNWHRRLEKADNVVADVTDGAADKVGNIARRDEMKLCERFLKLGQWIALALGAVENHQRVESDERKTAELFVAFGRFKEKTRLAVVDLRERG